LPSRSHLAGAALAAAALLSFPGQAAAKGVFTSVRVCGPSACVRITDRPDRVAISRALGRSGPVFPRLGPYLRVTTRPALWDGRGYLVPGQGIVELAGIDHRLGPRAAASIRRRVARVAPYRPRVAGVWVRGRPVSRPRELVAALRSVPIAEPATVWSSHSVLVAVVVAGATPWSGWGSALYFPALRVLHSPDGDWVRLTAPQARALAPVATGSRHGGGARVALAAVVLAGAALLAAGALALRGVHRPQASRS
jgi:hypothetical protein